MVNNKYSVLCRPAKSPNQPKWIRKFNISQIMSNNEVFHERHNHKNIEHGSTLYNLVEKRNHENFNIHDLTSCNMLQ